MKLVLKLTLTLFSASFPRIYLCQLPSTMLDTNAIIAVVTLFIMCVPGALFVIRVLRPRFEQWWNCRGHPNNDLQGRPLPTYQPPVLIKPPRAHVHQLYHGDSHTWVL